MKKQAKSINVTLNCELENFKLIVRVRISYSLLTWHQVAMNISLYGTPPVHNTHSSSSALFQAMIGIKHKYTYRR